MLHEALIITSLSSIPLLLYRPAVGWASNKKRFLSSDEALAVEPPRKRRDWARPAAAVARSCGKWLSAWLFLHLLVLLALVRGISSGGGTFAPELEKWQVSACLVRATERRLAACCCAVRKSRLTPAAAAK